MMQHHRASRPLLEESHTDDELHDLHTKLDRLAHSNRNYRDDSLTDDDLDDNRSIGRTSIGSMDDVSMVLPRPHPHGNPRRASPLAHRPSHTHQQQPQPPHQPFGWLAQASHRRSRQASEMSSPASRRTSQAPGLPSAHSLLGELDALTASLNESLSAGDQDELEQEFAVLRRKRRSLATLSFTPRGGNHNKATAPSSTSSRRSSLQPSVESCTMVAPTHGSTAAASAPPGVRMATVARSTGASEELEAEIARVQQERDQARILMKDALDEFKAQASREGKLAAGGRLQRSKQRLQQLKDRLTELKRQRSDLSAAFAATPPTTGTATVAAADGVGDDGAAASPSPPVSSSSFPSSSSASLPPSLSGSEHVPEQDPVVAPDQEFIDERPALVPGEGEQTRQGDRSPQQWSPSSSAPSGAAPGSYSATPDIQQQQQQDEHTGYFSAEPTVMVQQNGSLSNSQAHEDVDTAVDSVVPQLQFGFTADNFQESQLAPTSGTAFVSGDAENAFVAAVKPHQEFQEQQQQHQLYPAAKLQGEAIHPTEEHATTRDSIEDGRGDEPPSQTPEQEDDAFDEDDEDEDEDDDGFHESLMALQEESISLLHADLANFEDGEVLSASVLGELSAAEHNLAESSFWAKAREHRADMDEVLAGLVESVDEMLVSPAVIAVSQPRLQVESPTFSRARDSDDERGLLSDSGEEVGGEGLDAVEDATVDPDLEDEDEDTRGAQDPNDTSGVGGVGKLGIGVIESDEDDSSFALGGSSESEIGSEGSEQLMLSFVDEQQQSLSALYQSVLADEDGAAAEAASLGLELAGLSGLDLTWDQSFEGQGPGGSSAASPAPRRRAQPALHEHPRSPWEQVEETQVPFEEVRQQGETPEEQEGKDQFKPNHPEMGPASALTVATGEVAEHTHSFEIPGDALVDTSEVNSENAEPQQKVAVPQIQSLHVSSTPGAHASGALPFESVLSPPRQQQHEQLQPEMNSEPELLMASPPAPATDHGDAGNGDNNGSSAEDWELVGRHRLPMQEDEEPDDVVRKLRDACDELNRSMLEVISMTSQSQRLDQLLAIQPHLEQPRPLFSDEEEEEGPPVEGVVISDDEEDDIPEDEDEELLIDSASASPKELPSLISESEIRRRHPLLEMDQRGSQSPAFASGMDSPSLLLLSDNQFEASVQASLRPPQLSSAANFQPQAPSPNAVALAPSEGSMCRKVSLLLLAFGLQVVVLWGYHFLDAGGPEEPDVHNRYTFT